VHKLGPTQTLPQASHDAARIIRSGRVVACRLDETLLLIIGVGGSLTGDVPVEINDDPAARSNASVVGWRLAAPVASAAFGFAALLPVTDANRPLSTIRFGEEEAGRRYVFAPRVVSVGDAAAILAELVEGQLASTLDALTDRLMQGAVTSRRLTTIVSLLQSATASDGFIELLGESHDGTIVVKGWGRSVAPGPCRTIVDCERPSVLEFGIATFSRPDVPEGAAGFVGLVPASEGLRARDIGGLVYRGRGGWRYLMVHEQRTIAGPTETPGHIRSVLLETHSSSQVLLRLRAAANSFDGSETVSTLPVPVRMGIDNAFQVDGGGLLIAGWLLDPNGHAQSVKLRQARAEARLDDRWTRLDRADVTDAYADEPLFRGALEHGSHAHGFLVFADSLGDAASPLHLELTLADSRRAFLPITPVRVPARLAALRQIGSIDAADRALPEIIERQIVPFLCASTRPAPAVGDTIDAGPFDEAVGPPIVIAAGDAEEENIAPVLALLALDPESRHAPVALVMPAHRCRRQAARVVELAQFYCLSLRLISAEEASDACDLMEAGVRALTHETVVLLAGSPLPLGTGWYSELVAAHAARKRAIISPTLSYEDHSVRWAGSWAADDAGYTLADRYAGYPLSAVSGLKLTRVAAASFECCILPRDAFLQAGGFSGSYLGPRQKGLDLALRLGRSGTESYWLPSVQMLGCDDAPSAGTALMAGLVERIDRQVFSARWAPTVAPEGYPVERLSA